MASQRDVRRIAMSLPGTEESVDNFSFAIVVSGKRKAFAWAWRERVDPKKARVANPAVLVVRVNNTEEKAALIASDPATFFTEPHYDGFPAVLVRLAEVDTTELRELLTDAHERVSSAPGSRRRRVGREAPTTRVTRPGR